MDSRPPRVEWVARTDAPVLAAPLFAGDLLYAVDAKGFAKGFVSAFDAVDGSMRWRAGGIDERFDDRDPVLPCAPAVGGDLLFVVNTRMMACTANGIIPGRTARSSGSIRTPVSGAGTLLLTRVKVR